MIIRKPYAFLIKNFRKIHIVLLLFSIYVVYKLFDVSSYVNEFIRIGSYDIYGDPITKHINGLLTFSIVLLLLGSFAILILLYYKKKPWKIYLIPIIEYLVLLFILSMIKGFFSGYSASVDMPDLRLARDFLLIAMIFQVACIGIYVVRILGLDMKKFQFNFDQEFLELNEADREEVEIGLSYDKYSFIRGFKRVVRYLKYFYLEHRSTCRGIIVFIVLIIGFRIWLYFFVTHKTYSEGESYSVAGYTFKVNGAYYTDRDSNGNKITGNSNFLVIDMSVINHRKARTMYLENFHVRNMSHDYITTRRIYADLFKDLGEAYESTHEIGQEEQLNFIIIYKVDKKLSKNRFSLSYQEKSGILRKIKLKVKDLSNVNKIEKYSLGDELILNLQREEESIRFDYASFEDKATYTVRTCSGSSCSPKSKTVKASSGTLFLRIEFISDTYEAKNMVDFLLNYGKLKYIDDKGKEQVLEQLENPIDGTYYGKTVFLRVPVEVKSAESVYFDFVVRDKHYQYEIIRRKENE